MQTAHPISRPQRVPMKTVLSHILPTFLMGLFMTLAYLAGFHHPNPHQVPIAVVGSQSVTAPVVQRLQDGLGDRVSLSVLPTAHAARQALNNLQISGAFIPSAKGAEVLIAPAASDTTATIVQRMFEAVSQRTGLPIRFNNVLPLASNDTAGQNAFFFLVVLSVTSYALSIAIAAAGATRTWAERLAMAQGAALLISGAELLVAAGFFGMFSDHIATALGLSYVYSLAILLIGIGLHPLLGRFSTMIYATAFVGLNFTSSAGVFEPTMQPAFFGWLNHFWIGAAFIEAMRRIMYFPNLSLDRPLLVLGLWLVFGGLCVALGIWEERRHRPHVLSNERLELEEDVAV